MPYPPGAAKRAIQSHDALVLGAEDVVEVGAAERHEGRDAGLRGRASVRTCGGCISQAIA